MKRLALLGLVAAVCAIAPTTVAAQTTISAPPEGAYPYQRWIEEARVPTPPLTLAVVENPCPDYLEVFACTAPTEAIWFNAALVKEHAWSPRGVFYHELGHSFADAILSDFDRSRFRHILDLVHPWPNQEEVFADHYMRCAAPAIYLVHTRKVCELIRGSYRRYLAAAS